MMIVTLVTTPVPRFYQGPKQHAVVSRPHSPVQDPPRILPGPRKRGYRLRVGARYPLPPVPPPAPLPPQAPLQILDDACGLSVRRSRSSKYSMQSAAVFKGVARLFLPMYTIARIEGCWSKTDTLMSNCHCALALLIISSPSLTEALTNSPSTIRPLTRRSTNVTESRSLPGSPGVRTDSMAAI